MCLSVGLLKRINDLFVMLRKADVIIDFTLSTWCDEIEIRELGTVCFVHYGVMQPYCIYIYFIVYKYSGVA